MKEHRGFGSVKLQSRLLEKFVQACGKPVAQTTLVRGVRVEPRADRGAKIRYFMR